jgi:serpin B
LISLAANKIYVMQGYSVKKNFQDIAIKSFNSEAETIDFSKNKESAKNINSWVEDKTNNKIKDLISAGSLSSDSRMVIVNAIYFKGFWTHKFNPDHTFKAPFFLNEQDSVNVDYMRTKNNFKYGYIRELESSAIELPYKDSDISMLIILPNSRTGLPEVERKLTSISLNKISEELYEQEVNVELPKFKIEFTIELTNALKKVKC